MDFDPSAFLSVAMTEDQDAVYTAPDVPQGFSPLKVPPGKIVVEGGLQMEQGVQIPVPVFGLLQQDDPEGEEEEAVTSNSDGIDPLHVDTGEQESTTPQPSPGERTVSPCHKKIIHTTPEESKFRKELFCGHFEKVKIFRLHCSICDRHLGCAPWYTERQMRMHKLLSVVVCRKCFEFYGDINFPIEEGSELYCSWCGEGGECFCCSSCPKIVCKKCVKRNFGPAKVKEIDKNDDWSCFVCKPEDIWPHRALMWGLQRWGRGLRQLVSMLPKEEKQARLSLDTSHCCMKDKNDVTLVGLPPRAILSKIPMTMIATPYHDGALDVLARQETYSGPINGALPPNSQITYARNFPSAQQQRPQLIPKSWPSMQQQQLLPKPWSTMQHQQQIPRPMVSQHQQQQIPRQQQIMNHQQNIQRAMAGYNVRQVVHNTVVLNRPSLYPMNVPPMPQPPPPRASQLAPRLTSYLSQPPPLKVLPALSVTNSHQQTELIDLEKDSLHAGKPPLFDISVLENQVAEVKNVLNPTMMMLNQFHEIKNELSSDFAKLTSFTERLSYNIKIAICNLAKANTDITESQKKFIDNRVSTVVNNIQSGVLNNSFSFSSTVNGTLSPALQNGNTSRPKGSNPHINTDSSPEIVEVNPSPSKTPERNATSVEQTAPATPASSTGEEVEDAAIAMLCETVLEVGENKENKDEANKDQSTPVKRSQQVFNKPVKGKPSVQVSRKRSLDKSQPSEIQVIDLSDEEEEKKTKFDESAWCKKFKIVPCKVVLERLEILKVDVV